MKHSVLGWVCVFAFVALPLVGCESDEDNAGPPCSEASDCDDGFVCSDLECVVCAQDSDCDDGNDCTSDTCSDQVACSNSAVANGSACMAGEVPGTCDSSGQCVAGGTVDPCDVPLPESIGPMVLEVVVYAKFDPRTTPAGISFADDGTLYVGTNVPELTSPVLWVEPDGTAIGSSADDVFVDPDAVVVDVDGLVATVAGNVLIGGSADGGQTGQLMEMTPAGEQVGVPIQDPRGLGFQCLRNINHLIFDTDDRLLLTNFNNQNANVCAITKGDFGNLSFDDLIPDVRGDGPAGITVQDLGTGGTGGAGDLFVTTENNVYRYNSNGELPTLYAEDQTALAYGPAGSLFDGLLIRGSGMLLVRPDVERSDRDTPLLRGSIGPIAFYPNDENANLYISDSANSRVLRVSLDDLGLGQTAAGCPTN